MESTKQALLRQAVARVGKETLAAGLKVPMSLLEAWIHGHAAIPDRKLLALADFLDKLGSPETG